MKMNPCAARALCSVLGVLLGACGSNGREPGAAGAPSSGGASAGVPGAATGGGSAVDGGAPAGGTDNRGAGAGAGGAPSIGAGGTTATGGGGASAGSGTAAAAGDGSGGRGGAASPGGRSGRGGRANNGGAAGGNTGGTAGGAGGMTSTAGSAGAPAGTCTESKSAGKNLSGTGPHAVVAETNADAGIAKGTIFRPAELGGDEKYPIFVWGEGGCSQNGLSNSAAMAEIASYGYFVIADGTPNGSGNITMDRSMLAAMGAPLIAYVDWALAENEKPCSAYYHGLDTTKVAADGFSCGGLMAQGTITDPRITTWGVTSSGMAGAEQDFYDLIHTPVLFVMGGTSDVAYDGGLEGYQAIAKLDVPVLWFSNANLGHGGDLSSSHGGDFTKLNLAWLNWWLKGDETATGKGALVGSTCTYCSDSVWDVQSAHVP
jgi:hypothetical protein